MSVLEHSDSRIFLLFMCKILSHDFMYCNLKRDLG
jgi:hypothetical protein